MGLMLELELALELELERKGKSKILPGTLRIGHQSWKSIEARAES